jgi:hypothetical protein
VKVLDLAATRLLTDSARSYRGIAHQFAAHETVNHDIGEYVRGDVSTNKAENVFSQLKRSIDGTHHHVSRWHLPRYLAEFDVRFTTRKQSDTQRMHALIGRIGGHRLTYKRVMAI